MKKECSGEIYEISDEVNSQFLKLMKIEVSCAICREIDENVSMVFWEVEHKVEFDVFEQISSHLKRKFNGL